MFSDSVFAHPTGSFNAPVVPPNIDPDAGDLATVRVSCLWLPYIRGALTQLMLQSTWDTDNDGLQLVQQRASNLISLFAGNKPGDCGSMEAPTETQGVGCEDEMACCNLEFRNGVLGTVSCGVFTPVPGQGGGLNQPDQPGSGSGLPMPGGGKADYCYKMGGNDQRILPGTVSSGDTITFSSLLGAWTDTRGLFWYCPDGWLFVNDACYQNLPHGSPDPLPTALHMQLVVIIDGTYYDALAVDFLGAPTTFTVPPGISNKTVTIVANTDAPGSTAGQVSFCVEVVNNAVTTFTHTFDFRVAPQGFVPVVGGLGGSVMGTWISGVGFSFTDGVDSTATLQIRGVAVKRTGLPSREIIAESIDFDWTEGTYDSPTTDGGLTAQCNSTNWAGIFASTMTPGTGVIVNGTLDEVATVTLYGELYCGVAVSGGHSGNAVIHSLTVTGRGTDPY